MWVTDAIASYFNTIASYFESMASAIDNIPLIGGPLSAPFRGIASWFYSIGSTMWWLGYYLNQAYSAISRILSWSQIYAYISGTWSWLNYANTQVWSWVWPQITATWPWLSNPIGYLWGSIRANILASWNWLNYASDQVWAWVQPRITGTWSWLNYANTQVWAWVQPRITGTWSWLNSIDDKIRTAALSQWSWLNYVEDKIRTVAWPHVEARLEGWLLSWLMLNLTVWGRIGYRILDKVWNMEWDEDRKEVK